MVKYERKNLNIKRLLAMDVLDIRGMAERNETLTADEYFSKVEQFIENAPKYYDMIVNTSKLEENAQALKTLEERLGVGQRAVDFTKDTGTVAELEALRVLLFEIGYDQLDFDLDAICLAIKNANLKLAEKLAGEAEIKFNMLHNVLKNTYVVKKFTNAQTDKKADAGETHSKILLKDALAYLDNEETNRKMRILAVDDVSVILNTLTSVLSPYYEVFALKSGAQLAKFLTHTTPELFLLDIEMSDVNGFDLVPLIRRFPEHKDTPIIFLTGNASYNNLKDAIALGACDFITKPVNREVLLEKIAKNIVRKKTY